MTDQSPLILVDGSSYIYRAFHALPDLTTSKGLQTGAVKGVINMLRSLQKQYPQSVIVVVFDAKGKTFRDDICKEYKANRPPMPQELRPQIQPIHDIVDAMGLPKLVVDNVEADDVIGTLAAQASAAGQAILISTGDKDMAQLVNEHVTLVNTMTNTMMDPNGVIEKFGIPADKIIDYLALMGDKVDNIPGVPGVGAKTALALIQNIGGVDDIYKNVERIYNLSIRGAKGVAEKIANNEDKARLSYRLATIKIDVPLDVDVEGLAQRKFSAVSDEEKLLALYQELEFKAWTENLLAKKASSGQDGIGQESVDQETTIEGGASEEKANQYEIIVDKERFAQWLERLQQAEFFAFDTETTSLNYMEARVVGVSFAIEEGEAAYVPFGHDYEDAPKQLDETFVLEVLKPLLESKSIGKIGQNLKYDKHVLKNHDIDLQGIVGDSMLLSYILNSTSSRHDMDTLAQNYLNHTPIKYEEVAGKGAKQITFNFVPIEVAGPYAAEDADITLQLFNLLSRKIKEKPSLEKLYCDLELPLLDVVTRIEANGALIDSELLLQQSKAIEIRLAELETEVYDLAGEEFNLASPKQLQTILFEKLKLPVIKKTPKGQPSTAEPILQELALDYPLPKLIMEFRGLSKLKSTYTDALPQQVCERTGRIHTSYHQAVTATGRLSSTDPNLQNIPIRTEEGKKVRHAFIAPKDYVMLAADYSQIELRIMAHLSGDEGLQSAFQQNLDVHKATAAEVFGVGLAAVTDDHRRKAKAINFGLIYGMSAFGLAKQLGLSRGDAQKYIDLYFERYPGVLKYMEETRKTAADKGYVETLFNRRLYLPEINSSNGMRRQAAERTAINAPMQGTAADIIKLAMIDVDKWLAENQADVKMIMQVHDELVFEVPKDRVDEVTAKIKSIMENVTELSVPLIVDCGVGANWGEAH